MFVICYQLRKLVGHLVETEILLNQYRLNMFTYFFVKITYIHYRRQLNQKKTIRNDVWNVFWQSLPLFLGFHMFFSNIC